MRLRLSIDKIIMYFIAISLLIGSSCMWFLTLPFGSIDGIRNIQYIFLALFCVIGCFYHGKMQIGHKPILLCSCLVIYLLFYLLVTESNPMGYLTKHILIFVIFFFYCATLIRNGKVEEFADAFVNVVSVVAFISVFFWLFGSIFTLIKGVPTLYIWAGNRITNNYFWIYFENLTQATELFGRTVIRNTGIYAEAPSYSGYLIMALAIALPADNKKFPLKQKVLLVITMLTTLSTKGLIAVMILIALIYLFMYPAQSPSKFIQKFIFSIIIVTAASIGTYLLLEDKSTTSSYLVRMDDVRSAISTWKNHVLFGSGYQETSEIIRNFGVSRSNNGLSMGLTILLAQGGIYMVAFYILSYICALCTSRHIDKELFIEIMIFGIMILFNLLISSCQYDVTMIFILACGYAFACTRSITHSVKVDFA